MQCTQDQALGCQVVVWNPQQSLPNFSCLTEARDASNGWHEAVRGCASKNTKGTRQMKISKNRDSIIALAIRAKAGATAIGTAVGLAQHTAARITTDIEAVIGVPGSPT